MISSNVENVLVSGPIRGFLLDITGVLYNSSETSDGIAIHGSIEAVKRLYSESKVKFLSNESTGTTEHVVAKLRRLGFVMEDSDVITPAPVAAAYVRDNKLRPHLLMHKGVASYFSGIDQTNPNCVVLGDAEHDFTFDNVNQAFRTLLSMKDPLLISLGNGKFYQSTEGPCIDLGAYAAALKFSTGCRQVIIGKPSQEYFQYALDKLGLKKEETVMIGDDIVSDVGGAMQFGMRAIQVKTGKWRPEWESHSIKPSMIAENLNSAINAILENKN